MEHLVLKRGFVEVLQSLMNDVQLHILFVGQVIVDSFVNVLINLSHNFLEKRQIKVALVFRGQHRDSVKKVQLLLVVELMFVEVENDTGHELV